MSDFWRGRRALVTGGVGFIGSNLAQRLVALGADVLLVDSMLPAYGADLANIESIRERVRVNFSDIRDAHSLGYLVRDEDVIFGLAGQVSHVDSMTDPMTDLEINCRSQLSLLECVRRGNPAAKVVFASTRQIYGRPRELPVTEDHPLVPADVNGVNKLAAEMYHTLYHRVYGLRTVCLRLTNTYGPRMDLRSDRKGFLGVFVRRALLGEPIRIFGDGTQRRDFNHVDDVVDALLLAAERDDVDGGVFNLGHPTPYRLLDVAEALSRETRVRWDLVPFPPDAARIDIGDYYGDFSRWREATGWSPRIDLAEGLAGTLAWFRDHPELLRREP